MRENHYLLLIPRNTQTNVTSNQNRQSEHSHMETLKYFQMNANRFIFGHLIFIRLLCCSLHFPLHTNFIQFHIQLIASMKGIKPDLSFQ